MLAGKSESQVPLSKLEVHQIVLELIRFLLFVSGVCLHFNKGNELRLKRGQNSKQPKIETECEKNFKTFSWKKKPRPL